MEAPRLILRFRELTPEVDTIKAHLNIRDRRGSVWWGWWKKEIEPSHEAELRALEANVSRRTPIGAWLIDTSAERLHLAEVIEVKTQLSTNDAISVPSYYRKNIAEIPAWFRISKIEVDQPYRRDLEAVIGQNTMAFLSTE
jgi:hypothetical protein